MGCGCNKTKEKNTERQTTVAKIRSTVKKVWESTQPEQPTHIVKRINKKIIILPMAQSGTPTSSWETKDDTFIHTVEACNEVFTKKPNLKLDLVLWLKGESDRMNYTGYATRLNNIMLELKKYSFRK